LIITGNPEEVLKIYGLFSNINNNVEEKRVQMFLQYGQPDWDNTVTRSTKKLNNGGSYPITITDYWGGRGHDYRVDDEEVYLYH
jgi:hypothetical protein